MLRPPSKRGCAHSEGHEKTWRTGTAHRDGHKCARGAWSPGTKNKKQKRATKAVPIGRSVTKIGATKITRCDGSDSLVPEPCTVARENSPNPISSLSLTPPFQIYGTSWTPAETYTWKGGCQGFAQILSIVFLFLFLLLRSMIFAPDLSGPVWGLPRALRATLHHPPTQ